MTETKTNNKKKIANWQGEVSIDDYGNLVGKSEDSSFSPGHNNPDLARECSEESGQLISDRKP